MGWGEGEGAIFEPKTLSMYLKKEKEKKSKKKIKNFFLTEPGFEPTTFFVKPFFLSNELNLLEHLK